MVRAAVNRALNGIVGPRRRLYGRRSNRVYVADPTSSSTLDEHVQSRSTTKPTPGPRSRSRSSLTGLGIVLADNPLLSKSSPFNSTIKKRSNQSAKRGGKSTRVKKH